MTVGFTGNASTGLPVFDYSSRDYASVYTDLVNRIHNYLPEWTSRSNNDFGIVLLQLYAYTCDLLHYYVDRLAGEAFIQTATQSSSVLNLAAMLDYSPALTVGALTTLSITINSSVQTSTTIPAGTQFQTVGTATLPPIVFETNAALIIPGGSGAPPSWTGLVPATQGVTYSNEAVATSDGTVNQAYALKYNPVLANSFVVSVDIGQGPQVWQDVNHLVDNGPTALVYTTFVDANGVFWVIFGDGANGTVPSLGSPITCTYRVGVGAGGNVGAGTITVPVQGIVGLSSVTNPVAANGGTSAESLESIRINAPVSLRALNRAVTVDDIAALTLQIPGTQWASAQEATYQLVNLYVAPSGGGALSSTQQTSILNAIQPLVMANTTLTVLSPTYVGVNIVVTVHAFPNVNNTTVQAAVTTSLDNLLDITNTGFGYRVSLGLVYTAILETAGVNWCAVTSLYRQTLVTLAVGLVNTTPYTSLTVSPLPQAVSAGDTLIINQGGASNQTVTVGGGGAAVGATTIPVSFTANANYSIGTGVQDTTGVNDCVFLLNEIPVVGTLTVTVVGGLTGS